MGNGVAIYDSVKQRYFIDLAVTARYAADVPRWQASFRYASQILFEATHGQMQLGQLFFLNSGSVSSAPNDDIILDNTSGNSFTTAGPPTTAGSPFNGRVYLTLPVMNEPLVAVHELGHYVATLRDEYYLLNPYIPLVLRTCQNDPSTHECIMEFARGFGLLLDNFGNPSITQPANVVHQFCYLNHVANSLNHQHIEHKQSCWATLQSLYLQLQLPNGSPSINSIEDIQWIERTATSKYALAIRASASFAQPRTEQAIKNAAKEWVYRLAGSGDQLALMVGSAGTIRDMSVVEETDVANLWNEIDKVDLAERDKQRLAVPDVTGQFEGKLGAYQRLILLAPGNRSEDLKSLASILAKKRIDLFATTYGAGEFANQLQRLDESSKWVEHQNFPIGAGEFEQYAFSLQNELLELYFVSTPGYGIVGRQSGILPAIDKVSFAEMSRNSSAKGADGLLEINLELRSMGVDVPMYIETDAHSATFILSELDTGSIEFSLVAPDGRIISRKNSAPTADGQNVTSFDVSENLCGRWILRLRRTQAGAELPFHLVAAAKNLAIGTTAIVKVSEENLVSMRFQSVHQFPLDFVDTFVDIYRLLPDEKAAGQIFKSLVLSRERALDPRTQRMVEVSTGWYHGETQLAPASYIGVFRASHHGQAIYATNLSGIVDGNLVVHERRQIPAFSRVVKRRFQVPSGD